MQVSRLCVGRDTKRIDKAAVTWIVRVFVIAEWGAIVSVRRLRLRGRGVPEGHRARWNGRAQ
jgi:hypothetical protein